MVNGGCVEGKLALEYYLDSHKAIVLTIATDLPYFPMSFQLTTLPYLPLYLHPKIKDSKPKSKNS